MKAVTYYKYGGPEVLAIEDIPNPQPKENELLIRVCAATVSATDSVMRKGSPFSARMAVGFVKPTKPVLGTEFAGVVEEIGSAVTRFKTGDEIWAASGISFGAHAEFICLPEDGAIALKPAGSSFADAAAICEGGLTALTFLRDSGKLEAGQSVLINGASGSVGSNAVQIAKHMGAEVTGVCSTANVELVRSLGAGNVIDYRKEDFTQQDKKYDIVFDAVGKSSFPQSQRIIKPGGKYLRTVLGFPIIMQMLWTSMFGSRKAIIAFAGLRAEKEKAKDLKYLRGLVEAGELRAVVDSSYAIEQARNAHARVDSGRKVGAAILTV